MITRVTLEAEADRLIASEAAEPLPRNIDRARWLQLYRQMRMLRGRAMHWLNRAANVASDEVASPITYAKRVVPMFFDTLGLGYARMTTTRFGEPERLIFALHVPEKLWPDSAICAWSAAVLALQATVYGSDKKSTRAFRVHFMPLVAAFGSRAWRMIDVFVQDAIVEAWRRTDEAGFAHDLFAERVKRFKRARGTLPSQAVAAAA